MMFDDIFKNKTVLITGHTGFKGSWLSLWLHSLGAEVIGYSLEPPTYPNLFTSLNLEKTITHRIGDVRDEKNLKYIFLEYNPEFVFHMAAQSLVRRSYKEPKLTYETNVMGTVNLLEAVRETKSVKVVLNITSDKCYENKEWIYGYRETDPMGGYDPYSSSKGCAELITTAYRNSFFNPDSFGDTHHVALASARAGNVIGGGDWAPERLIPDCIRAILKKQPVLIRNPEAIRPWQHVLEPLSGYLLLAKKLCENGTGYPGGWNFGPEDYDAKPVKWLAYKLCAKWGEDASFAADNNKHPHEAHYLKLDCSRAKSELGWHPRWDLEKALGSIIEWTKAYQEGRDLTKVCLKQIDEYSNTSHEA